MNIRELILDSKELIQKIDIGESVTVDFLCHCLGIEKSFLMELFERENLIFDFYSDEDISPVFFKQIILKEPETSSSPSSLREIILSSEKVIEIINRDVKFVLAIVLCRNLDIGLKTLAGLFSQEGFSISEHPTFKVSIDILRDLIAPRSLPSFGIDDQLKELESKIDEVGEREYQKSVILNQFIRSENIRVYAKLRANGICELCETAAPFSDRYGSPYLEVHHIVYLSKGGRDSIDNVAAICPNCHRKLHNLNLERDVYKLLSKRNIG